jgi:ATP-dependent DNA helicase RecG
MNNIDEFNLELLIEDSYTQLKEKIINTQKLAEEIVAFSNAEGGKIFIGISDKKEIIGLTDSEINSLNQLIANVSSENIKPPIYPLVEIININNKKIVVISIKRGINKPYQTSGGLYLTKSGSDKRKMSQDELKRLFAESNNLYADEEPLLKTNISDFNTEFFYSTLEIINKKVYEDLKSNKLSLNTILQNLDLMSGENLTLAGNLLFGRTPQRFSKSFYIDCVYFDGTEISTNKFIHKERINGTFSEIYKHIMIFLKSSLKQIQISSNFNSLGQLEIPEATLSELFINALIHRDYYINSSIKVFLFSNRLEIISPGKLANSLNIEKIKNGISIHRNPILNSLAQYILPYSGLGSGIKRALEYYPQIEFINDTENEQFQCILFRNNLL